MGSGCPFRVRRPHGRVEKVFPTKMGDFLLEKTGFIADDTKRNIQIPQGLRSSTTPSITVKRSL